MSLDKIFPVQQVPRYVNPQQEQLRQGDLFRATVVNYKDNEAMLRVRGEMIRAMSTIPLKPGETALFQVKGIQDNLLVLKKQEFVSLMTGEKTIAVLLQELGLPASPEGKKIVSHLLSKDLPLSKNLVEQILKDLHHIPEELKENFIKIKAWLYGTRFSNAGVYQDVLHTLLYSSKTLDFLENLQAKVPMNGEDFFVGIHPPEGEEKDAPGTGELKKQLADLIIVQREINSSKQDNPRMPDLIFYPIPLYQGEHPVPAQLYLVMKNKSSAAFQDQVSLLLSVKTENMGMLWFDIKVKEMTLNITAYTQDPKISEFLTRTWHLLKDGLERSNFHIDSFCCREKTVSSVFELADDLGNNNDYRSIDVRV